MKPTAILSVCRQKGIFKTPYKIDRSGSIALLSVKNRNGAIKKLIKALPCENTVIARNCENEETLINRKKLYEKYNLDTVFPILEVLCRKTAQKFGIRIPFAEVYIEASPAVACGILAGIQSMSRIFTVVSAESPLTNSYDELYFKHGTVIRHIPGYCNNITSEAVIIRCDTNYSKFSFDIPVINFTSVREEKNLTVNVSDVFVRDEKIDEFLRLWGGYSSIFLYELLGEKPEQNAEVDINKKADKIFLLDTDKN